MSPTPSHSLPLGFFSLMISFSSSFMPQVLSLFFLHSPFTITASPLSAATPPTLVPIFLAPLSLYTHLKLLFFHCAGAASLSYCPSTHKHLHTLTHTKAPGEVISLGLQLSEQQASACGGYGGYRLTTHLLLGKYGCVFACSETIMLQLYV